MATEVELPFWPSCQQNVQWSEDNLIAVAGGSSIAILVPRLDLLTTDNIRWDTVMLKADGFSTSDVSLMHPLSAKNWSVGEELAQRTVSSLRWSTAGLGMFNTCVLGVLYSDHTLAVWECIGRPELTDSWKKALIVNHILRKVGVSQKHSSADEASMLAQRIRAFAWWPVHSVTGSSQAIQGPHMLAISTESGHIVILHVHSPHKLDTPTVETWQTSITHRVTYSEQSSYPAVVPPILRSSRPIISDIIWGDSGAKRLDLILISNGIVYLATIPSDSTSGMSDGQIVALQALQNDHPQKRPCTGPLQHIIGTEQVMCFQGDNMVIIDPWVASYHELPINANWSEISGSCSMIRAEGGVTIQLTTHRACDRFRSTQWSFTEDGLKHVESPSWQLSLVQKTAEFSVKHRLAGNVAVKTHGLTAMPQGRLVAACVFITPSDSIIHTINSDKICTVLIADIGETRLTLIPDVHDVFSPATSSLLLNTYQELLDHQIESPDTEQLWLDSLKKRQTRPDIEPKPHIEAHESIPDYLKRRLYDSTDMMAGRAQVLARRVCNGSTKSLLPVACYHTLVSAVGAACERQPSEDILSQTIMSLHRQLQNLLNDSDTDESPSNVHAGHEKCSICGDTIAFEAVRWARCVAGHKFVRCAVTLVTILQPGLSKSCLICGTQYLHEQKLEEICSLLMGTKQPNSDRDSFMHDQHDGKDSLARLLLTSCDRCLMCGGKFASA